MSGRKIHKIKHYKKIKCSCGEILIPSEFLEVEDVEVEGKNLFIYYNACGKRHKLN